MGQAESAFNTAVGFGKYLIWVHWVRVRFRTSQVEGQGIPRLDAPTPVCVVKLMPAILSQRRGARKAKVMRAGVRQGLKSAWRL